MVEGGWYTNETNGVAVSISAKFKCKGLGNEGRLVVENWSLRENRTSEYSSAHGTIYSGWAVTLFPYQVRQEEYNCFNLTVFFFWLIKLLIDMMRDVPPSNWGSIVNA